MAIAVRAALACAVLLSACARADSPPKAVAGVYETLLLAVGTQGEVQGYYREEQGTGVTKTCEFFFSGSAAASSIPVKTWETQSYPGELKIEADAVTLKIPEGSQHPGCGLVLPPQIADKGVEYGRTQARPWVGLRVVTADKAWFYAGPSPDKKRRAYVVKDDVLGLLATESDWLQVEYAHEGKIVAGWIRAADATSPAPP